MICVSLAEASLSACLAALQGIDFAEIRLDLMPFLRTEEIEHLFSFPRSLIATCRPGGPLSLEERRNMLSTGIRAGAAYVDLEVESESLYRRDIVALARLQGCRVIISFHDHKKTPGRQELDRIVETCFQAGADIAKISCLVHTDRDNARLLGLLDNECPVVPVGMGEKGRITRIVAPLLGSPFTFASRSPGKETAPGQIDHDSLRKILCSLKGEKVKGCGEEPQGLPVEPGPYDPVDFISRERQNHE